MSRAQAHSLLSVARSVTLMGSTLSMFAGVSHEGTDVARELVEPVARELEKLAAEIRELTEPLPKYSHAP